MGYFVLLRDISDLSLETFVALQFSCSLLCHIVLNKNKADRF